MCRFALCIDVFINADNSSKTGGKYFWTDPTITHSEEDNWGAIIGVGSGITSGAGSIENGYAEISINRDALDCIEFADTFTIGIMISQDWYTTTGLLPCERVTVNNPHGETPKLKVIVDKEQ